MNKPDTPTDEQLHALSSDQCRAMLWHLKGWMHDDAKFDTGLAHAYADATDTSRAPLTVRCTQCPYIEAAYTDHAAARRAADHFHTCVIEPSPAKE